MSLGDQGCELTSHGQQPTGVGGRREEGILSAFQLLFLNRADNPQIVLFLTINKKIFWLHHTACGGLRSLTRDRTHTPSIGSMEP